MEEDPHLGIQSALGIQPADLRAAELSMDTNEMFKSLRDQGMISDKLLSISMAQAQVCLLVFLQARSIQPI